MDRGLAGEGNYLGEFTVYVGGLDYEPPPPDPIDVDPSDPGEAPLTELPDQPVVNDLAGTLFLQHSSNSFTVAYDLDASEGGWEGVMVRWEDFTTVDLSSVTQFVFGVQGDPGAVKYPDAIKVEFEAGNGAEMIFNLNGVTDSLQHWHIDASEIDFLDELQVIAFVVDGDLAGDGNEAGAYTVYVDGLEFDWSAMAIAPSDTLTDITVLQDDPLLDDLVGTEFVQHSSTNFTVLYDLDAADQDWEGVRIHRDGLPIDLTLIETFVVGVTGTPQSVKMEVKDFSGGESIFFLNGVTNSMQQWLFNAALIPNRDDIEVIAFVVDYGLAGEGNEAGAFTVFIGGLNYEDNGYTDGIPNAWWDLYEVPEEDRVANAYPASGNPQTYLQNFVFNTDPRDSGDVFENTIGVAAMDGNELVLWSGTPTSDARLYDVWVCEDILATPQVWTALNLDEPGRADTEAVELRIDTDQNDALTGFYRVGVKVPEP